MRILFLGDIVGRPGRKLVSQVLPKLIKQKKPDLVIANAENLAGGKGINKNTLAEMKATGIDYFTGGNHIFKNPEGLEILESEDVPLVIPANFAPEVPGKRWSIITSKKGKRLLLVSLLGQTFMPQQVSSPFRTIDHILEEVDSSQFDASLIDIHAEATSEKYALRWHLDGKVSAVVGTHTHVPTADTDISPNGTGFQADVGMNGSLDSCIGVKSKRVIKKLITQLPIGMDLEKRGRMQFNAVLIDIGAKGQTKKISHIREILD